MDKDNEIELVEFSYPKYGQHTVAVKLGGFNLELCDACKVFKDTNSLVWTAR